MIEMTEKQLKLALESCVSVSNDILNGTPVFKGTRVPVKILYDYLKGGENLTEFLDNYPTVEEDQAKKVLEIMFHNLESLERDLAA